MSFVDIVPRDGVYLNYNVSSIPLNVIRDTGVNGEPDVKIQVTDLNEGKKSFLNQSGLGDKFKISIIIDKEDTIYGNYAGNEELQAKYKFDDISLVKALDKWIKDMVIFNVRSDSMEIENGEYIITANPARKQTYEQNSIWELEFTKYTGVNIVGLVKKSNKGKSKALSNSALNSKLKKCNYKKMTYGKSSDCILHLNQKLRKKGYLSKKSWNKMKKNKSTKKFTKATKSALKSFQGKYNKKHKKKLKANGKLSKNTLKALIKT